MVKVEILSKWQDMLSNEYESQTWANFSSMDKASKHDVYISSQPSYTKEDTPVILSISRSRDWILWAV